MASWIKSLVLVTAGTLLGLCFAAGLGYGVLRGYVPLPHQLGITSPQTGSSAAPERTSFDLPIVREAVQEILSSPQAEALVREVLVSTPPEALARMLREAVNSPEFRKVLAELLLEFFRSPEGMDLFSKVVKGSR